MILKRGTKPPFWSRVREAVAPRKGWRRGFDYIGKRMKRLPDTPHRIALGFACGAFISFSPFFTLHFLGAALLAWVVRANILSALFGTVVGNPLTFPFIATVALGTGHWILGNDRAPDAGEGGFSPMWLWDNFADIFVPYLVGGIGPGLICAAVCYWLLRPLVTAYQKRRRKKISEKAAKLSAARRKAGRPAAEAGK